MRHTPAFAILSLLCSCAAPGARRDDGVVRDPVAVTTEGQRAYDDLAAWYRDPDRVAPIERAFRDLAAPDPVRNERAGLYLAALLRQAREDERKGRPDWKWVHPATARSWKEAAREVRVLVAEPFGASAGGEAALPVALWLVDEEDAELDGNAAAGIRVLRRVRSDRSAAIFRRLLAQSHPNAEVVKGAIEEVAARGIPDAAPDLVRLCRHYRAAVRGAARAAAESLGLKDLPEFRPEEAFTPWLDGQIRELEELVLAKIPMGASWRRVVAAPEPIPEVPADPELCPGEPEVECRGWVLGEDDAELRLLLGDGDVVRLAKDRVLRQEPSTLEREAAALAEELRSRGPQRDRVRASDVRPVLMAAWCRRRGAPAAAAALLFPELESVPDDRLPFLRAARSLGSCHYAALLNALTHDRDYLTALALACQLAKPVFIPVDEAGPAYHRWAVDLAEQLPHRLEDFKTFTLPAAAAWEELRAGMDRRRQIDFLAGRLRLLNRSFRAHPASVPDGGDPGSRFDRDQFAIPERELRRLPAGAKAPAVINPCRELVRMRLTTGDLPTLAPHLANRDFMPWVDADGPALLRVNRVVAGLVNDAGAGLLVDPDVFFDLADDDQQAKIDQVVLWAEANAGKPREVLAREAAEDAKAWASFRYAVGKLVEMKSAGARPLLERRKGDFEDHREEMEALIRALPGASGDGPPAGP